MQVELVRTIRQPHISHSWIYCILRELWVAVLQVCFLHIYGNITKCFAYYLQGCIQICIRVYKQVRTCAYSRPFVYLNITICRRIHHVSWLKIRQAIKIWLPVHVLFVVYLVKILDSEDYHYDQNGNVVKLSNVCSNVYSRICHVAVVI